MATMRTMAALVAVTVPLVVTSRGLAQTADRQQAYQAEVKEADREFKAEATGCKGDSGCIKAAAKTKADAVQKAGKKNFACERAVLKAQTPQLDRSLEGRGKWSAGAHNVSVYTDEKGQRWSFQARVSQPPHTWVLDTGTPPRINQMGSIREVYGTYREAQNRLPPKLLRGVLQ